MWTTHGLSPKRIHAVLVVPGCAPSCCTPANDVVIVEIGANSRRSCTSASTARYPVPSPCLGTATQFPTLRGGVRGCCLQQPHE